MGVLAVLACGNGASDSIAMFPAGGAAGMAPMSAAGALPTPMVLGEACQAYDFELTDGCIGCNEPFFCNCPGSGVYPQTLTCTVWGLCLKSYDCTQVCSQESQPRAYAEIAECMQTRACISDRECPNGLCVNGGCSTGASGAVCAAPSECKGAHCVAGRCTNGEDYDRCLEDADCQSGVCVSPSDGVGEGRCGAGTPRSPCTDDGDCLAGKCVPPAMEVPFYNGQCSG